ncbi:MAG: HAD hydrolase-like protein, partial [Halobacteriales archaeon]|nr:HAD hydrolase-like protein [Halobacteriales archaeon]
LVPALRHAFRRRKPAPGMLEDGGAALGADRTRAVMVGDKVKDAEAAAAYGIPAILLATTHTAERLRKEAARRGVPVHSVMSGLPEAVEAILAMADPKP